MQRTLSIIKPDAVRKNLQGKIIDRFLQAGFRIVAMKQVHLTLRQAEGFYAVHQKRPFFPDLTKFMSSGPCIALVLEADDAIQKNRDLMGATNPANAKDGTIRQDLADNIQENCVHGSDSLETANFEIGYFFSNLEFSSPCQ